MAKLLIELSDDKGMEVKWTQEIANPVTLLGILAVAADTVKEYFAKEAKSEIVRPPPGALPPLRFPPKEGGFNPFSKNGG